MGSSTVSTFESLTIVHGETDAKYLGNQEAMKESIASMTIALRVLNAIVYERDPDLADLEELRRLAPLAADMPVDDLACAVIRHALKRLEENRLHREGAADA